MKKVVSLILVVIICIGLSACGGTNNEDVKRALIGTWETNTTANFGFDEYDPEIFSTFISYRFNDDGTFSAHAQLIHKRVGTVATKNYSGTYTIQGGEIKMESSNWNGVLDYTYQNGVLSVYTSDYTLTKE